MTRAANEVAFGLENLGVAPRSGRASSGRSPRSDALLSGGERSSSRAASCSASASRPRSRSSPSCCCSTSRPRSSTPKARRPSSSGRAPRRDRRPLRAARRPGTGARDRVIIMEEGRILLDAPRAEALEWLAAVRRRHEAASLTQAPPGEVVAARARLVLVPRPWPCSAASPRGAPRRDRRARRAERHRQDDARPDRAGLVEPQPGRSS